MRKPLETILMRTRQLRSTLRDRGERRLEHNRELHVILRDLTTMALRTLRRRRSGDIHHRRS